MAIQPTDSFKSVMDLLANTIHEKNDDAAIPMTIEQMIEGVDGIGGGLPTGIRKIEMGTFTPTANITVSGKYFDHALGEKPNFMIMLVDGFVPESSIIASIFLMGVQFKNPLLNSSMYVASLGCFEGNELTLGDITATVTNYVTESKFKFNGSMNDSSGSKSYSTVYYKNRTYTWIAGCLA